MSLVRYPVFETSLLPSYCCPDAVETVLREHQNKLLFLKKLPISRLDRINIIVFKIEFTMTSGATEETNMAIVVLGPSFALYLLYTHNGWAANVGM